MIALNLVFPEANVEIGLFYLDVSMYHKKEILQAITGEVDYNNMQYTLDGLEKRN